MPLNPNKIKEEQEHFFNVYGQELVKIVEVIAKFNGVTKDHIWNLHNQNYYDDIIVRYIGSKITKDQSIELENAKKDIILIRQFVYRERDMRIRLESESGFLFKIVDTNKPDFLSYKIDIIKPDE